MLIAVGVFLPLYFLAYWTRGPRILIIQALMCSIGIAFGWHNPGAAVFFVYAGCFVSQLEGTRAAQWNLAGIIAIPISLAVFFHLPPGTWIPAVIFTLLWESS